MFSFHRDCDGALCARHFRVQCSSILFYEASRRYSIVKGSEERGKLVFKITWMCWGASYLGKVTATNDGRPTAPTGL